MQCEVCGARIQDGHTVYRANPKGQRGRWRCAEHVQGYVDPVVQEITAIIEDARDGTPEDGR